MPERPLISLRRASQEGKGKVGHREKAAITQLQDREIPTRIAPVGTERIKFMRHVRIKNSKT